MALLCVGRGLCEEQAILDALEMDRLESFADSQGFSMTDNIMKILSGQMDFQDAWSGVLGAIREGVTKDFCALFAAALFPILAMAMLRLLLSERSPGKKTAALICRAACVAALARVFLRLSGVAVELMRGMAQCAELLAPVMIAAVRLSGMETTAAILSPMTGLCVQLIERGLYGWGPGLSAAAAGIAVAGGLSENVRLGRLFSLIRRSFNMAVGFMMAAFMGLMSVQGKLGGGRDSAAVRTTKYAIESMIPIIGGNVSESLEALLSTACAIKNAVGASGLLLLAFMGVIPLARLALSSLAVRALCAVMEPLDGEGMTLLTARFADAIEMLLVAAAASALLCALLVGGCMSAAGR